MKAKEVQLGSAYEARVSGKMTTVTILKETLRTNPRTGAIRKAWLGRNESTGREVRIATAGRLRRRIGTLHEEAMRAQEMVMCSVRRIQARDNGAFAKTNHWSRGGRWAAPVPVEAPTPDPTPQPALGVVQVRRNEDKGGLEIVFPVAPPAEVRADLVSYGFRYSRRFACWWAKAEGGMTEAVVSLLGAWNERGVIAAVACPS